MYNQSLLHLKPRLKLLKLITLFAILQFKITNMVKIRTNTIKQRTNMMKYEIPLFLIKVLPTRTFHLKL